MFQFLCTIEVKYWKGLLALDAGTYMAAMVGVIEKELRYFRRWLCIAVLIGIVSGIGAVIFNYAIHLALELFLGRLAGYYPPHPGGRELTFTLPENRLLLIIPPALGGLLSGIVVYTFAPEAEGHGTDAAIEAFHYKEGTIRPCVPLVKLVASAITIGSGGSAGKEGPVAQIGGGFGSFLAQILKLSPRDRRIALAIGVGSGIGAIFKAPFGGAIFASEILYTMDFEPEVIPPAFVASFIGYLITGYFTGWSHIFSAPNLAGTSYKLYEPVTLALFTLLGIINGIFGILYVKTFYGVRNIFRKITNVPDKLKPAIGGLVTGLIGVMFPYVFESSYGWLQMIINGDFEYLPLHVLLLLPLLKILATAFSIGSGGSGGVFAPALVIGGSLGAIVWHIARQILPGYDIPVAAYAVVGMMSFFGGVGKVPIATILMVGEMTGEYELFAPSLIATFLSYIITGHHSIYESQLRYRHESPAHEASKIGLVMTLYEKLREEDPTMLMKAKAADLMVKAPVTLSPRKKVSEIVDLIKTYPYRVYPVVDDNNKFLGFVRLEEILLSARSTRDIELDFLPIHRGVTVKEDESLGEVLEKMIESEADKIAVVDEGGKLKGIITAVEVLRYVTSMKVKGKSQRGGSVRPGTLTTR